MAKGNFGERLKRERELREVPMDELSKATRISNRFLQALENEDWDQLPGGVFGHGFVRSIARYLGLDEEALLGEYDLARSEKLPLPPPKLEERIPTPPKWIPFAVLGAAVLLLVIVLLIGLYGWHRFAAHRASKHSAEKAAQYSWSGGSYAGASGNSPADASLALSLSTSAVAHVRILADDRLVLDKDVPAGETLQFTAKQRLDVSSSNSSAVLLELNGKATAPLGRPGAFGRMVYTLEDLRRATGGNSHP
ncbi:MAG TPA: helix-turn-helix domain-containing protein [Candidatus Acidoferrum sp.]|nr:helix-turn-helix domain-containing protein [Candidatus Acidoferrum sp.]